MLIYEQMNESYRADNGLSVKIILYLFHDIYMAYLKCLDNFRSEFLTLNQGKAPLLIYDSKHFQLSSKTTNFRARLCMSYFAVI